MTQEETIKYIETILGIVAAIGGFLYWHFKEVHKFKDEIHKVELKLKELEKSDALQQQTLDQLNELYPTLKSILENLNARKK